jgi:hypothetical protein
MSKKGKKKNKAKRGPDHFQVLLDDGDTIGNEEMLGYGLASLIKAMNLAHAREDVGALVALSKIWVDLAEKFETEEQTTHRFGFGVDDGESDTVED